jgi:two-component system chemotaxis response regulator CheY
MEENTAPEMTRLLLLAEDDEAWRELLCNQFHRIAPDWKIVCACEGREAMHRLGEMDALHALVTDLHMPEMDGLELIEWVREQPRYRTLPVFVVSSSEDPAHHKRCTDLGVEKFMSKPGSLEILRNHIREIVRLSEEPHVHFQFGNRGSLA